MVQQLRRWRFLEILRGVRGRDGWTMYAWCLMSNHYHLVVRTGPVPLARSMGHLQSRYAAAYNRRWRSSGPLWQSRYKAKMVETGDSLGRVIAYVHLNPVTAGVADDPSDYPLSGHRELLRRTPSPLVDPETVLSIYGSSVRSARRAYVRALEGVAEAGWRSELPGRLPWWRREPDRELAPPTLSAVMDEAGRTSGLEREDVEAEALRPQTPPVQSATQGRKIAKTSGTRASGSCSAGRGSAAADVERMAEGRETARARPDLPRAASVPHATARRWRYHAVVGNVYFDLTEEFNAERPVAVLGSGQAVVYHRLAIMSKDGDWILEESPAACDRVLEVLEERRARYRPGAPLDVRWLSGGWSSHLEFADERGRRVRCDFFTRPPRLDREQIARQFEPTGERLLVVGVEALIRMKQTQRAKDYPVIGELARRLEPAKELEVTTDVDRILELGPALGAASQRPAVRAAQAGAPRDVVVALLAQEIDALQNLDRERLTPYQESAVAYVAAFRRHDLGRVPLPEAHSRVLALADGLLPRRPAEADRADAE